ncbi:hypothetical protein OS493_013541 [Desmophyllum pertusum]|uniref:Netrin receptor UNC5A-D-like N-terminal domain-containing protein n=1 Tax=Desmophyllum pertusum TaxID=174260 RepID=A0A9X0A5V6_9CNID|nr:hypothetical protein OS493_013541 [Desmophyllum pertusum]
MESRVLPMLLTIVVSVSRCVWIKFGHIGSRHGVVKPEYVAEPDDKFVLPNSPAALLCEAKFVTKLKFNCSKGLVPKEIYNSEDENNATLVIAEISQVLFKSTRGSDVVCICVAIGYNGHILRSRAAKLLRKLVSTSISRGNRMISSAIWNK